MEKNPVVVAVVGKKKQWVKLQRDNICG